MPVVLDRSVDELYHHGVKGMKWGVRKDDDKSSGGSGKVGESDGTAVALAAFGAVYAGILIAVATAQHRDSGKKTQKKNANVAWKKNDSLSKPMSIEDLHKKVVAPINPGFGQKGTMMNCRRCTFTYEMRRRGNDVQSTLSSLASGQDAKGLQNVTKGTLGKPESIWGQKQISQPRTLARGSAADNSKAIYDALGTHPNGARGEITVGWRMGGGHSMAWEIVKNKPVIFDTQSGVVYGNSQTFEKFAGSLNDAAMTRLDNVSLNDDFIRRWSQNV